MAALKQMMSGSQSGGAGADNRNALGWRRGSPACAWGGRFARVGRSEGETPK